MNWDHLTPGIAPAGKSVEETVEEAKKAIDHTEASARKRMYTSAVLALGGSVGLYCLARAIGIDGAAATRLATDTGVFIGIPAVMLSTTYKNGQADAARKWLEEHYDRIIRELPVKERFSKDPRINRVMDDFYIL